MANATLATVDRALLKCGLAERGEPAYRAAQVWRWAAGGAAGARTRRPLGPKAFKVNLIPYNPTGMFVGSPPKAIAAFKDVLDGARRCG